MPEEYAPPVVAVVVTADAGAWLEACLESLEWQDYPSLDVLVVETGADDDVTARVAAVMPNAFVRRRPQASDFGAAANDVLEGIEGASFFLFCHDDVALAPDAVRLMVGEAYRSNAGIVGPKLVDWESPEHLLQIGLGVSKFATPVPRVLAGELDQSQHDEVREVFAVPSACLLARVDLFAALGGFDADLGGYGEDVDLCWRAQLAGARVVTAPRAVVRHEEASLADAGTADAALAVRRRNELRTVLKNYGRLRRWLNVVQLLVLTLIDSVTAPLTDRRSQARAGRSAWRWNLGHRRSLHQARSEVREIRQVGDRTITARMTSRSRPHRLTALATQAERETTHRVGGARRELRRSGTDVRPSRGERRREVDKVTAWLARLQRGDMALGQLVAAVVLGLVLVAAVRNLLLGQLPVVGDLAPGPRGLHLLDEWVTGRSDPGWRSTQVAPAAFGVLGAIGTILGDSSAMALKLIFVSGVLVGTMGSWRLVRDFGAPRARVVAAVAFAGSPLVWNGLGHGDLEASVALAGMPFVIGRLARASKLRPFAPAHGASSRSWGVRSLLGDIAPLGLLLGVMGALAPPVVLDVGVVVAGSLLAAVAVKGARGLLRSAVVAGGGVVVAFLCCLPWSLAWFSTGSRWSLFAGPLPASAVRPADLLRGHTGPVGGWWGAAGLVLVAAVVFVWARGPRLAWATRLWVVAIGSVALAWAAGEGWLGSGGGRIEVFLAPAAVAFAACCGIAAASFELDVKRYRFGWRQAIGLVALVCFVAGLLPALGNVVGGRGGLPGTGFEETASEFSSPSPPGARVLWIGNPAALPGSPFQAGKGLAAFVTTTGLPSMSTVWPTASPGPASGVVAEVRAAVQGRTLELGSLLAPAGIRFIVVPLAAAPVLLGVQAPASMPPPGGFVRALAAQVDLRQLPNEGGIVVWENAAWTPSDGAGTLAGAAGGRSRTWPLVGIVVALLTVVLCLAEGLQRRRAPRRAGRPAASAPTRARRPSSRSAEPRGGTEAASASPAGTGDDGVLPDPGSELGSDGAAVPAPAATAATGAGEGPSS